MGNGNLERKKRTRKMRMGQEMQASEDGKGKKSEMNREESIGLSRRVKTQWGTEAYRRKGGKG